MFFTRLLISVYYLFTLQTSLGHFDWCQIKLVSVRLMSWHFLLKHITSLLNLKKILTRELALTASFPQDLWECLGGSCMFHQLRGQIREQRMPWLPQTCSTEIPVGSKTHVFPTVWSKFCCTRQIQQKISLWNIIEWRHTFSESRFKGCNLNNSKMTWCSAYMKRTSP